MTYADEVTADAPYLWAKLNNAVTVLSGSNTGFSAASNNVTFTNGIDDPASSTSGASFSGTSSYINWTTASNAHSMFNTGVWSVELWFKRSSPTGNAFRELLNTYDTGPSNAVTVYGDDSTGKVALYYRFGGQANTIISGPTISDTNWHHVVATRDGTTVRLYVDGTLAGSSTNGTTGTFPTSNNIWVGAYGTGASNENWNGRIDEIAIYKGTALSATRIAAHYANGNGNFKTAVPAASLTLSMPSVATRVHAPAAELTLSAPGGDVVIYDVYEYATETQARNTTSALDGTIAATSASLLLFDFATHPGVPTGQDLDTAVLQIYAGVGTAGSGNAVAGTVMSYVLRNIDGGWSEGSNSTVTSSSATYGSGTITIGQINEIDISQLIELWDTGQTTFGILIDMEGIVSGGSSNWNLYDRTNSDTSKRPLMKVLYAGQAATVDAPPMVLSLNSVTPTVRSGHTAETTPMELDIETVTPSIHYGNRLAVPAMTGTLTFVGGEDKNPDTVAVASFIEAWLTTPNADVEIRYPSVALADPFELDLSTVVPTLNLTTGKLVKVNNAMSLTVRMVGIYIPGADRYHTHLPTTINGDDIWYKMDDGDGATRAEDEVSDSSTSYDQDGYYFGGPDFGVDGPYLRKAVSFDGVDDYMIVGPYSQTNDYGTPNPAVSPSMALTVEFSFKTTQANGVIFAGTGAQTTDDYPVLNGNELRIEGGYLIIDNHDSPNVRVRNKRVDDGEWHHIIMSMPSLEDGATGGTGGITSTGRPAFLLLDGDPAVVRYSYFGFDSNSGGGSWIPFSFMARAVPKFGPGKTSTTNAPVASDTVTGHMAGTIRDLVVRLNGWLSINAAQKLYYEWSESNVVIPPPMELSLSTVAPFSARGNTKRMLALYGLPWVINNFGTDPQATYFSNLSGMILATFSEDGGFNVNANNSGQGTLYYKPKPYTLHGYLVYPVSVVGVDLNAAPKPYSADGIISEDAVIDSLGYFVDDHTGLRRFVNLQTDLAEPVTNFDCITAINYPWEEPNHNGLQGQSDSSVVGNGPGNIEYHGAAPNQPNMGLTNAEWATARDALRDSILEAAYDGLDLWIGEYHMAHHLGFIQGYDIHKPGYWMTSGSAGDNRGYNLAAEELDKERLPLIADEYEWCGVVGDYYSNAQANFYRRVVALEDDLTDMPTNEYGDYVEGYAYDAWRPNGDFLAYDIVRRPSGLELGDRVMMSMYFWKPGDPQSAGEQSLRFSVISARPDGIVGKVITRELMEYSLPFGEVYDNPYKNNAITIAAERGTILRGRALGGRAFIELMDTNVLGEYIAEDADKFLEGGNPTQTQSSLWDFDTRRYREIKINLVSNRLVFDPNSGQFENIRRESNYFNYQDGDMIQNVRRSMHERGLNWLSQGAEALPAGAVKAVVPAMELTLRTPAVGFSRTRNLNLPVIGAMRLDIEVRNAGNYQGDDSVERAFPMILNLDMRGTGKKVSVPPFVLSLSTPNAASVTDGDRITVYMDTDRTITLFLKEDN